MSSSNCASAASGTPSPIVSPPSTPSAFEPTPSPSTTVKSTPRPPSCWSSASLCSRLMLGGPPPGSPRPPPLVRFADKARRASLDRLHEDVDLAAARQADAPGEVVGDAVAEQL